MRGGRKDQGSMSCKQCKVLLLRLVVSGKTNARVFGFSASNSYTTARERERASEPLPIPFSDSGRLSIAELNLVKGAKYNDIVPSTE